MAARKELFGPRKLPSGNDLATRSRTASRARAEERRLAEQARAGDPGALRRLLETLSAPVYRFGRRFCRNPEDAEDLMQEALAALVRTLPRWRGEAALSTWAYTVARNTCGRMRRRRAGAPARVESLEDAPARLAALRVAAPGDDPARAYERSALADALERALAALPPAQREVVLLRDVEGLSAPEVARVLGLGETAVKSRLHRGRLALRRALAPAARPAPAPPPRRRPGCPDTARLLSRYLEGELDAATCRRLSRHVEACSDCTSACTSLRASLGACARLGRRPVPPAMRASIRRSIRALTTPAR